MSHGLGSALEPGPFRGREFRRIDDRGKEAREVQPQPHFGFHGDSLLRRRPVHRGDADGQGSHARALAPDAVDRIPEHDRRRPEGGARLLEEPSSRAASDRPRRAGRALPRLRPETRSRETQRREGEPGDPIDPKAIDGCEGEYRFSDAPPIVLVRENGRLFARTGNQKDELFTEDNRLFFTKTAPDVIEFVRDRRRARHENRRPGFRRRRRDESQSLVFAMRSISRRAPAGSSATATVERAGRWEPKRRA